MVANTGMIKMASHSDNYGELIAIEAPGNIPFTVKRIYYIYDVEKRNKKRISFSSKTTSSIDMCARKCQDTCQDTYGRRKHFSGQPGASFTDRTNGVA